MPTRIYQINTDLAVNIPVSVLPPPKIREVEEIVTIPGYAAETYHPYWYYCIVRAYKDRTVLLLKPLIEQNEMEMISRIGLDPYRPLYVHLKGTKHDRWIRASKYHTGLRVNIPAEIERRLKISSYDVYPVLLRGTTFPERRIKIIRKPLRKVLIDYMGKQYPAEETGEDRWRWVIPKELEPHPVLLQGFKMIPPIYPLAEMHRLKEIIYIDFLYYSDGGKKVSEQIGYAFRNMAVRNYTASATADFGYPFLCEIRATFISSMPKRFYQITERPVYDKGALTLKQALETCVYNMLEYFFPKSKAAYAHSSMSWAEYDGIIESTVERVNLPRRYPRLKKTPNIISEAQGEESLPLPQLMEPWEIIDYPYYKCIKYIRIINEYIYENQDEMRAHGENPWARYVYDDAEVERVLYQNEEKRVELGLEPAIWIDGNGFVWKAGGG